MGNNIKPQFIDLGVQSSGHRVCGFRFEVGERTRKAMFWFMDNCVIKYVIVVLDAKYENIVVRGSVALLSLRGLKDYNEIKSSIMLFLNVMKVNQFGNIQFRFICDDNQKELIRTVAQELALTYTIQTVNNQEETKLNSHIDLDSNTIGDVSSMKVYVEGNMILNLNNDPIGMIGEEFTQQGNTIYHNGIRFATVIRDDDIELSTDSKKNTNLRVLKPSGQVGAIVTNNSGAIGKNRELGRAAFVSLPVIMFVLSALLLIASIILLFVLD